MSKTLITALAGYTQNILETELYFQIFPVYYETNTALKEYKEKRYILRWKLPSNLIET